MTREQDDSEAQDDPGGAQPQTSVRIRLLFADEGSFHHEEVTVPAPVLDRYGRLIDCLREEPSVLKRIHVDLGRLCSAIVVDGEGEGH